MTNIYNTHITFAICLKDKKIPKCVRKYIYDYSNYVFMEDLIECIIDTNDGHYGEAYDDNLKINTMIFNHMRTYYKGRQFYDIQFVGEFVEHFFNSDFIPVEEFDLFTKLHKTYYKYMAKLAICYFNNTEKIYPNYIDEIMSRLI